MTGSIALQVGLLQGLERSKWSRSLSSLDFYDVKK